MGYKPISRLYDLSFEDHPGLEVRCKGATLGELDKIRKLEPNMNEPDDAKRLAVFAFFSKKVVVWNIDHPEVTEPHPENPELCERCGLPEGTALPISVLCMQCLELPFIMSIVIGWVFAVSRVSLPKELNSNGGGMNGQGSPLPDGLVKAITSQLESLQNPMTLPEPNFTLD